METSKQDILKIITRLAEEHAIKKKAIENILDNLDKEKIYGEKHTEGMTIVNTLLKEIDVIEAEHRKCILEIKKK